MCFDDDSHPPVTPVQGAAVEHEHLDLSARDGNIFDAFVACATESTGAGIIVLPDYHGLTDYYEELALRFAEIGVDAMAVDYYGRSAPTRSRDASFDHIAHADLTTWAGLRADVRAAADSLRTRRGTRDLFSIGFCFGGRVSFLLASVAELDMAGVIGFYGWPTGAYRNDTPAPADVADELAAPLLAIFGGADTKIPAQDVDTFERALAKASVDHRLVSYEGAPHSFFDRRHDAFEAASANAWAEVCRFIEERSSSELTSRV